MLAVFGITIVGTLTGASISKGLIAACLGLIIGAIGISPGSSEYRLDFSNFLENENSEKESTLHLVLRLR